MDIVPCLLCLLITDTSFFTLFCVVFVRVSIETKYLVPPYSKSKVFSFHDFHFLFYLVTRFKLMVYSTASLLHFHLTPISLLAHGGRNYSFTFYEVSLGRCLIYFTT